MSSDIFTIYVPASEYWCSLDETFESNLSTFPSPQSMKKHSDVDFLVIELNPAVLYDEVVVI